MNTGHDAQTWKEMVVSTGITPIVKLAVSKGIKFIFVTKGYTTDLTTKLCGKKKGSSYIAAWKHVLIDFQQVKQYSNWFGIRLNDAFVAILAHEVGHALLHSQKPDSNEYKNEVKAWDIAAHLVQQLFKKVNHAFLKLRTIALGTYGVAPTEAARAAHRAKGTVDKAYSVAARRRQQVAKQQWEAAQMRAKQVVTISATTTNKVTVKVFVHEVSFMDKVDTVISKAKNFLGGLFAGQLLVPS